MAKRIQRRRRKSIKAFNPNADWSRVGTTKYPPDALKYAKAHALTVAILIANNVRYVTAEEASKLLGFKVESDGLAIPFPGGGGQIRFLTVKEGGKKFLCPVHWKGSVFRAAFERGLVRWKHIEAEKGVPLHWCEGPFKAMALAWHCGCAAFAVNGTSGWGNEDHPLEDLTTLITDCPLILVIDSDVAGKQSSRAAIQRQYDYAVKHAPSVYAVEIPSPDSETKVDVNDYLNDHRFGDWDVLEDRTRFIPFDYGGAEATRELNRVLAYAMINGQSTVLREEKHWKHPEQLAVIRSTKKDMGEAYASDRIIITDDEKNEKWVSKFDVWFHDKHRRVVDRLFLHPDKPGGYDPVTKYFNLWSGWAFAPKQPPPTGAASASILTHIWEVIACKDESVYEYLMNWMARGIQQPATVQRTAIVLIGGQGTGKGAMWEAYGRIFGQHFKTVSKKDSVVGNFNAQLKDALLIHADEAFFAGDHPTASALKGFITSPTIEITEKFKTSYFQDNMFKLAVSSNDTWVVSAEHDDRRYVILNVSEAKKGDAKYFTRLFRDIDGDGPAELLWILQQRDLSKFNPDAIPHTQGRWDQKKLSFTDVEGWLFGCVIEGTFGTGHSPELRRTADDKNHWDGVLSIKQAGEDMTQLTTKTRRTAKGWETVIGLLLSKVFPGLKVRPVKDGERLRVYQLPSLRECEKAFEKYCRMEGAIPWDAERGRKS